MSKGRHVILDCTGAARELCLDDARLLTLLTRAAKRHRTNIINSCRYRFGHSSSPGCTAFLLVDESHISAHTYADDGKIAIDVFTCGDTDAEAIADDIVKALGKVSVKKTVLDRFTG